MNYLYRGLNEKEIREERLFPRGNANLYQIVVDMDPRVPSTINFCQVETETIRHQLHHCGYIFKDHIERIGLDWPDVVKKLVQNGLAELQRPTEIILKTNPKREESLLKEVFGKDFNKLNPILEQSLQTAGVSTSRSFNIAVKFATNNGTKNGVVVKISVEKLLDCGINEFDAEFFGVYEKRADQEVILYARNGGFYFPKEIIVEFIRVKAHNYLTGKYNPVIIDRLLGNRYRVSKRNFVPFPIVPGC